MIVKGQVEGVVEKEVLARVLGRFTFIINFSHYD